MRLRRVETQRFRGIRELSWDVSGDFICLLGPGDSTKTTILDAIELALSPRWNVSFDDADFYGGKTDEPIVITVTIGDLPDELKRDSKFGLLTRGWTQEGELHDEPGEKDELVLSIRLSVDSDLEPSWVVANDRDKDGKQIGYKDRERLGCVRLGDFLDRHFAWGRGSALSRLTSDVEGLNAILAAAARAARGAVAGAEGLADLNAAATKVGEIGAEFGVAPRASYQPHLDVHSVSVGTGGLSLHDGEIPVRRAGLGTRRLLAIAMQRGTGEAHGLSLIDEIEQGLEPHRLRHLLRVLRNKGGTGNPSHTIMTTHSPIVLGELRATELYVVRSAHGVTTVRTVPHDLQNIVRKASEAFLARKVLVCEGKTELGFCRGLDSWWEDETGHSFGLLGVALAEGGGSETGRVVDGLVRLGYDVGVIADSDKKLEPGQKELEQAGASVFLWEGGVCIEERLAMDLPWGGVGSLVKRTVKRPERGKQSVLDSLKSRCESTDLSDDPSEWIESPELRLAIGVTAREKSWFKRVDLGEELVEIVKSHWAGLSGKPLRKNIEAIRTWVHGD